MNTKDLFDDLGIEDAKEEMTIDSFFRDEDDEDEGKDTPSQEGGDSDDDDDEADDKVDADKAKPTEADEDTDSDEDTPEQDNVPFHKHPRFKAIIDKNKALEDTVKTLQDKLETKPEDVQKTDPDDMPEWAKQAFGTDEYGQQLYSGFLKNNTVDKGKLKAELVSEIKAEQQAQAKTQENEVKKWQDRIDTEVQDLKDKGYSFNKNELLDIVDQYTPKDSNGNFTTDLMSFDKAYDILQLQKKSKSQPKADAKKKIASMGAPGNKVTSGGEDKVTTSADLRNKSIEDYY